MEGYVYCFTNPSMPNLNKCGGTKRDPQTRCKELFNTSLPVECRVEYYIKVNNWRESEKEIHDKIIELGFKRFKGREWFECSPNDIKLIFDNYPKKKQIINSTNINNNMQNSDYKIKSLLVEKDSEIEKMKNEFDKEKLKLLQENTKLIQENRKLLIEKRKILEDYAKKSVKINNKLLEIASDAVTVLNNVNEKKIKFNKHLH